MEIEIREYISCSIEELLPLYESVGWTNYTARPEMLERAYQNSLQVLAAYDGPRLAGILRAVGDGCSIVFIQDILVFPEYQRKGVGTALVRGLLERCPDVYQIELATDREPRTMAFYRSLGFAELSELGCTAFMRAKV